MGLLQQYWLDMNLENYFDHLILWFRKNLPRKCGLL